MSRLTVLVSSLTMAFIVTSCSDTEKPREETTFTLSGAVTGAVMEGVTVTLGDAGSGFTVTDSAGHFSFSGLKKGTYTLTASLPGYTFAPATRSIVLTDADMGGQDFVATAVPTYSLSGTITGAAPSGVTLTLTPGGATAISASDGTFALAGIMDGAYTLTPSKEGIVFDPPSLALTVAGANHTGLSFASAKALYTLSGTISGASSPVTVRLTGDVTATTRTDSSGHFSFPQLGHGQSLTLTPSLAGHTFSPASHNVTLTANATASFTSTQMGAQVATFTGTLSYAGTQTGRVFVTVTCADGTALDRGVSLDAPGFFTVHGVQCAEFPTTAVVKAWIDTLGIGRYNRAADPVVTKSLMVTSATSIIDFGSLVLEDAAPITPINPYIEVIVPGDDYLAVAFERASDLAGDETAKAYRVYWSTTVAVPGPGAGNHDGFVETPPGPNCLTLTVPTQATYNVSISAINADGTETTPSPYYGGAVTIPPPPGTRTLTGQITFGELPPGNHTLYLLAAGQNQTAPDQPIQVIFRGHKLGVNPTSPATFSMSVPEGIYALRAIFDMDSDDIFLMDHPTQLAEPNPTIAVAKDVDPSGINIELPWTNVVTQAKIRQSGTHFLDFQLESNLKVPVRASVIDGPSVPLPLDLGIKNGPWPDQHPAQYFNLEFSMDPAVPQPGDTYMIRAWYEDGSHEDIEVTAN